jgi:hypothetical protein
MADVRPFISYAREDADIARRLFEDISVRGGLPWLDVECLLPGQDWTDAVRVAIREASHFIALISTRSVNKRGYVQKELRQALEIRTEFPPGATFVIPVRIDPTIPVHQDLLRLHWLDLFPSYEHSLPRLMKSLGLPPEFPAATPIDFNLEARVRAAQREALEQVLQQGGTTADKAKRLGVSRARFVELLHRYRIL